MHGLRYKVVTLLYTAAEERCLISVSCCVQLWSSLEESKQGASLSYWNKPLFSFFSEDFRIPLILIIFLLFYHEKTKAKKNSHRNMGTPRNPGPRYPIKLSSLALSSFLPCLLRGKFSFHKDKLSYY